MMKSLRGLAKIWRSQPRLAAMIVTLVLSACRNVTDNQMSAEMQRLLGKDFNHGIGYIVGMAPIQELEFAWCGRQDAADLAAEAMQTAVDRSVCISDQEKREAREWLITFASTIKKDLRRYVDAHGGPPDRTPWPDIPNDPSPLCKNIKVEEIDDFRKSAARGLASYDQNGRGVPCHPVPGP
jgi:hypothetical protein